MNGNDFDFSTWIVKELDSTYQIDLRTRFFKFAIEVMKFLKTLDSNRLYDVFRYQLSKSVTSIGANYEEAQAAFSRKEFASKIGICLKEARESGYFLRLILELNISNKEICAHLVQEANELQKIIGAILVKVKK